jgi:type II secretory pathway component HofQ
LAAALQQISQANTGPEMTLGFDEETNSLIVLAPAKLLAEVETLVQTMDTAAMESARTIKLVPLKQTNTEAIQRALDSLIQDGRSGGRRYRGRGRDGR